MYVRLAFAVAAHLEPEVLVVDEVLAVGDSDFQKKCLRKMQDISSGEGRTVLFVSHNLIAVRQLCPRTLLLVGGELDTYAETAEVLDRYQVSRSDKHGPRSIAVNSGALIQGWNLRAGTVDDDSDNTCRTRDEADFEIPVRIEKPLKKCEFGFVLRGDTEEIIYSANSRDFDGEYFELKPGNYLFRFKVYLPLRAGSYIVDLAIGDEGAILDHFVSPTRLTILDDYSGVLPANWKGILNESFIFERERTD